MRKCKSIFLLFSFLFVSCALSTAADNSRTAANGLASQLTFPYSGGWLGADDAYSIPLGNGRSVWLFGDTLVGNRHTTLRAKAVMVRNSVGISTCQPEKACVMQYWWKNMRGKARSFIDTGKDDEWYWPLDGYLNGDALYVSLMTVRNKPGASPTDPFGFEIAGTKWARITNLSATPDKWHIFVREMTGRELWPGSSIFRDGQFLLFYTQVSAGEGKGYMTVMRVPMEKLEDPAANFEYLDQDAKWHSGIPHGDSLRVIDQAISEMSVRYHATVGKWVAISPGLEFPSKFAVARTSDSPIGPWSSPQNIFEFPEMEPTSPGYDKETFCYATKEHTEFGESKIVLTYTCNSFSLRKVMENKELYRPRVVVLDVPH